MNYVPGEARSCTGCHGHSNHAALRSAVPSSRWRCPGRPARRSRNRAIKTGQRRNRPRRPGDSLSRPISSPSSTPSAFLLPRRQKNPAGGLRFTGEITLFYNTSYEELAMKGIGRSHHRRVHDLSRRRPGQLEWCLSAAPEPGLFPESVDGHADPFGASEERQARPFPDADENAVDGFEPLGGCELPVLRQLLWPAASSVAQSRSARSCL